MGSEAATEFKNGFVIKRNGQYEAIDLQKIQRRLERLAAKVGRIRGSELNVNTTKIAQSTIAQMYIGITTTELDVLAAEVSAYISDDPDYELFGGNILVDNLMSNNADCFRFKDYAKKAFETPSQVENKTAQPLITKELYDFAMEYGDLVDTYMNFDKNFSFGYFAMMTLIKSQYLLCRRTRVQINGVVSTEMIPFESPQHLWMRVAVSLHCLQGNVESAADRQPVKEKLRQAALLYEVLSNKEAIFGSPTLFQAGTRAGQLSSCFLVSMKEDSIEGIFETLTRCAKISKGAGGVGLAINNVRSFKSYIAGTNGESSGIVPMLRVFNATSRYVDQGGGKRKGAFAVYLSPWHADIEEFLDLRLNSGSDELRARDLFLALWVSDLFMKRAKVAFMQKEPVMWSLFDPNVVQGLDDMHGDAFVAKYEEAERAGLFVKQVDIKNLFIKIADRMITSGGPFFLFKDACNHKSNQKNLGTIHGSNLCTEIVQFSSPEEVAVCNVGSVNLRMFVTPERTFDFERLKRVTRIMIRAFNRVIDVNKNPIEEAARSNQRHRSVGLGIQGLADALMLMKLPFESPEARVLSDATAETMYFAGLTESAQLAFADGPYPSIDDNGGAPIRHGILQQDMWDRKPVPNPDLGLNWDGLRMVIREFGVRNSLLFSHPPTASTSNILGSYESFEPPHSNVFPRKTKAGEFLLFNPYLVQDLKDCGLWKQDPITGVNSMRNRLFASAGSIQHTPEHPFEDVPEWIRQLYKTVTEVPLDTRLDLITGRACYVCQSSSNNVHLVQNDKILKTLIEYIFKAHHLGLKTGVYYVRVLQKSTSLDFAGMNQPKKTQIVCNETVCTSCTG